ncbi:MAG TPA: YkgJ family cysteine cluster protein [Polyangia bacterium]
MTHSDGDGLMQQIIDEAPRLGPESRFRFACHPGVGCFNACCGDVNIVLTPYDVLRLSRRLGLGAQEFLSRHTILPFHKEQRLPIPLLKMRDDERKSCPFVGPEGCTVYTDRPWPCRMYPLGVASTQTRSRNGEEFYFVLEEPHCLGHAEAREWRVADWLKDQDVTAFDEFGEMFKEITLHPRLLTGAPLDPRQLELYYMATYELDRFRRFIFDSRFLACFEVAAAYAEKLRTDDEELLRFGFQWLRFSLFGERTMKVRPEALAAKHREQAARP